MEEIGIVKSIDGPFAKVAVQKKSICEQCTAGTCYLTDEGAELDALNEVKAQVGQRVKVVIRPYTYLKGSLLVYGVPTLALVVGAVVGKEFFADSFKSIDSDLVSAIFAFGAFALSFIIVKIWSSRAEKKIQYKPVIEEILTD